MMLWRIASTSRQFKAEDLDGAGAALYPGRWNAEGEHVVYAALTIAMATLETVAHIDDGALPLNRYLVAIDFPDGLWDESRENHTASSLPISWDAIPSASVAEGIGSTWYAKREKLFLVVPSVIVPEEMIVVINATHPDIAHVSAKAIRKVDYSNTYRR